MDSSVSLEDRIWFLRVCHHVPFALYHFESVKRPSEITFLSNALPKPETALGFGKIPRLLPFLRQVKATCMCRWEWSTSGMILAGENQCMGRGRGTLSQRHNVHHKSHIYWPEVEPRPLRLEAGNCLIHGTAYKSSHLIWAVYKSPLHRKHHISRVGLFNYWCPG